VYDFVYDSVYALLPKVSRKLVLAVILLKCQDRLCLLVSNKELDPYLV
jgi:hypothetical protein